jgi:hypothetical protein
MRWFDDLDPLQWWAQHMTVEEHKAPVIHLDAAPGVDFYHRAGYAGMGH